MPAKRIALLCGVAFSTLFVTPALAQGSGSSSQPADVQSDIEDIVVTAQRREERAQDVPIVISAFNQERLERLNVTEPQDLYGTVPSLVSGTQGQATRDVQSYSIRGQSTGFLASPGVQLYLNEVPLPSSISLNLQGAPGLFVDPENVQVLSGPQGTLFGRNTTGGAVLFQAHKPVDRFEGYIEGSVGNLKLRALEGAINIPLVGEKVMIRASAAYQDRRGFTRDLVWNKWRDDVHWYSGRVGLVLKPTERFENYLLLYGSRSSNNGAGHIHGGFNIAGLTARGYCTDGAAVPGVLASCDVYRRQTEIATQIGPRKTRGDLDGFSKIRSWGAINTSSLEVTDELTLRNIVSYQKLKDNYGTDQDGTPLQQYELSQGGAVPTGPIPGLAEFGLPRTPGMAYLNGTAGYSLPRDYLKQLTEELQLQGIMLDGKLTFAVGGFYYDAKPAGIWGGRSVQFCAAEKTGTLACGGTDGRTGVSNRSKALYGQGTLDLGAFLPALDNLRLTAGYRYTWDRIKGFSSSWAPLGAFGNFCVFGPPAGTIQPANLDPAVACNFGATLKSKAPTWTIGLDYKPIDHVLLYGKVSRGYKAGGFNTFAVRPETQIFVPEELTTYEAGFKSDWRVGTMPVRLNATYYYSDYKNIQRPGGDFNITNNAGGAAIFAATATIQGVEVEASIRPTDAIEIGGTFSHADGDYKKYEVPSFGAVACNGFVPFGGTADYSCAPFQFLTPWIYNVYASVKLPVPESLGQLSLFVSYSHVDPQYSAPGPFEPGGLIEGYGLLNGSISWNNVADTGFDLTIFGNNLTDKLYRVSNSNSFAGNLALTSLYGEPRTYGLKLRYRFGER